MEERAKKEATMELSFDTLYGFDARKARTGGRDFGLENLSRREIEGIFGGASIEGSSDDKVDFAWIIEIEGECLVQIWNYKNKVPLDRNAKTWWSVNATRLGEKMLEEITRGPLPLSPGWTFTK